MPGAGHLVLVDFPFTNLQSGKLRPVLILADAFDADWLMARVTSQPKSSKADIFLTDWQAEGLKLPSWVQLSKLATIEGAKIHRTLGTLSRRDSAAVRAALLGWIGADGPR